MVVAYPIIPLSNILSNTKNQNKIVELLQVTYELLLRSYNKSNILGVKLNVFAKIPPYIPLKSN